jgi:dsDNA-specific endonuclease/ATPase MutS2
MKRSGVFQPCIDWLRKSAPILSPYGKAALDSLFADEELNVASLKKSFSELSRLIKHLAENLSFFDSAAAIFAGLRDIRGTFANLEQGQILAEVELFEIKTFALQINRLIELYQKSDLKLQQIDFSDFYGLIRLLNPDELITSSFYIHEAYSEKLRRVRLKKREVEQKILKAENVAQKEILRAERSKIVADEKQLEFAVREKLSLELCNWLERMRNNASAAGKLELMLAKAILAKRWPSCKPEISAPDQSSVMRVEEAINPEIAETLEFHGKSFTPVSIELKPGVTILTGANMGGKTVALMTLAMNAELTRLGFFPFAKSFAMPLYDFICFVGGDGQNQSAGLSSFGAEIIRFAEVAKMLEKRVGLAIFDEFARSTNPYEGTRFVQALCEFLQSHRAYGIVATHYDGIRLADASYYQVIGLKEHQKRDGSRLSHSSDQLLARLCKSMDYRLKKLDDDYQVPRDALHIADLLDADEEFLKILRKYYD